MEKHTRLLLFLIASFVSVMGDTLLVFAVPIGLGLETRDLSATAFIWLVPTVSMFTATFLQKQVVNRRHSARTSYASIVMSVAILELVVAFFAMRGTSSLELKILIGLFVLGYAFIKEGVPRLLYVVSVYNYFGEAEDYSRIAGLSAALNTLAALAGTLLASLLISKGSWKYALLIDAASFLVLGCTLFFAGRDPKLEVESVKLSRSAKTQYESIPVDSILMAMAIVPIVDCLVFNYIPMLGERYQLFDASVGLCAIGILRLPGMFAGLGLDEILKRIKPESVLSWLPVLLLVSACLFIALPSIFTVGLLVGFQGLMTGLYWPTDYSLRNKLAHHDLVDFNVFALRWLITFQALSCLAALAAFKLDLHLQIWIPFFMVCFALVSWILILSKRRGKFRLAVFGCGAMLLSISIVVFLFGANGLRL